MILNFVLKGLFSECNRICLMCVCVNDFGCLYILVVWILVIYINYGLFVLCKKLCGFGMCVVW